MDDSNNSIDNQYVTTVDTKHGIVHNNNLYLLAHKIIDVRVFGVFIHYKIGSVVVDRLPECVKYGIIEYRLREKIIPFACILARNENIIELVYEPI